GDKYVKAVAQRREGATTDLLAGRVLCHDVRDAAGKVALGKGARLDAEAARTLLTLPCDELHLLALEAGDLHEEDAGRRLAASVTGGGVEVKGYSAGQRTLTATRRGLAARRRRRDERAARRGCRRARRRGRQRARSARSRVRRPHAARRAYGAARRARASRQPAVPGALAGPAGARHADLRHVLAGDHVRSRAPAPAGRRGDRQRGDRRPRARRPAVARDGLP